MSFSINNPGSRVSNPDLDWTQLQETIVMLCLAATQIESSMTESDSSFEEITGNSLTASMRVQSVIESLNELRVLQKDNNLSGADAKLQQLINNSEETLTLMQSTFIALQFYDRFIQQLAHVNGSIQGLGKLMGDVSRLSQPNEWMILQQKIKASYSTEIEREVFDKVVKGVALDDIYCSRI